MKEKNDGHTRHHAEDANAMSAQITWTDRGNQKR